jgi:hypothetical protein
MLVVDIKATGEEIAARSICSVGAFMLLDRETDEVLAGASDRFRRLVTARARDILIDLIEVRFQLSATERPEVRFEGRQSLGGGDRCRKCGVGVPDKVGGTRSARSVQRTYNSGREGRSSVAALYEQFQKGSRWFCDVGLGDRVRPRCATRCLIGVGLVILGGTKSHVWSRNSVGGPDQSVRSQE